MTSPPPQAHALASAIPPMCMEKAPPSLYSAQPTLEVREATAPDEQNRALWSLASNQIARPVHNGVQMDTET